MSETLDNYSLCRICGTVMHKTEEKWNSENGDMCFASEHVLTKPGEYKSEKFNNMNAEILWFMTLEDRHDDEIGNVESTGWFAVFYEFTSILDTDNSGFVNITQYGSEHDTLIAWQSIEDDYEDSYDDDESDYYDMSDPYDKEYDL